MQYGACAESRFRLLVYAGAVTPKSRMVGSPRSAIQCIAYVMIDVKSNSSDQPYLS